jgi:hypothetical protein
LDACEYVVIAGPDPRNNRSWKSLRFQHAIRFLMLRFRDTLLNWTLERRRNARRRFKRAQPPRVIRSAERKASGRRTRQDMPAET